MCCACGVQLLHSAGTTDGLLADSAFISGLALQFISLVDLPCPPHPQRQRSPRPPQQLAHPQLVHRNPTMAMEGHPHHSTCKQINPKTVMLICSLLILVSSLRARSRGGGIGVLRSASTLRPNNRFTFLATLFLLLFVSSAIILRSFILRRRFRRRIEEAILAGVIPPPQTGRVSRRRVIGEKPKLWEARVFPASNDRWDGIVVGFLLSYF